MVKKVSQMEKKVVPFIELAVFL